MSKLLMLGTGYDMAKKMYNTCFIIQNDDVIDTIEKLMSLLLPVKLIDLLLTKIELIKLKNNEKVKINGCEYLFFDLNASSCKQFGFEVVMDEKKMFFLGDVTLNKNLYSRIINSDIVLHEAFCLDEEEKNLVLILSNIQR